MLTRPGRESDQGFTLIELLISVVIMGIIAVPLAMGLFSYFKNSGATVGRLTESHQAQISSVYFGRDVSGIGLRSTTAPFPLVESVWVGTQSSPSCGSGTPVLVMAGSDYATDPANPTNYYVAYALSGPATDADLIRTKCPVGGTPISNAVAHGVVSSSIQLGCTYVGVSQDNCSAAVVNLPLTITLSFNVGDNGSSSDTYAVTLTGNRRQT